MVTQTKMRDFEEEKVEVAEVSRLDAAVGAAFIASGVGSLVLGLAIIGSEISSGIKSALTWTAGVGPLSGKTGVAVIAFVLSWVVLHFLFRDRPVKLLTSFYITLVLVALGLLLTFPPVFLLFE